MFGYMNISIVLLGVTGDLASRKIIPAIAALSHDPSYNVQMIGISRSTPDTQAIGALIETQRGMVACDYVQGSYTDKDTLQEALDLANSPDIILVYLAVPPHLFTPILQTTCALDSANVHIVVEKPFGQSLSTARELIEAAQNCSLTPHVHFFDHYLFKQATYLSESEKNSLSHLCGSVPESIEVRALEALGVQNRLAYYDGVGATKDMWQHLYSLANFYAELFNFTLPWPELTVDRYERGQYTGYAESLAHESQTETYFRIQARAGATKLEFESGKQLGFKETLLRVSYSDGTIVDWNINPSEHLRVSSGVRSLHDIQFPTATRPDHTRLFQTIVRGEYDRFVTPRAIFQTWQAYEKILSHATLLQPYEPGAVPQFDREKQVG